MSLLIWLPLNGDLHNQGLSDLQMTASSNAYTSGKIGSAIQFNGSNQITSTSTIGDGLTEFSFSCWIYPTTLDSSWRRIMGIGSHTRAHLDITSGNALRFFVSLDGTTSNYVNASSSSALSTNTWYHICGTIDNDYIKLYINGDLVASVSISDKTISYTNADYFRIGGINSGNQFIGSMNDARFYDHCLSVREIKELSKGLVLHYPLTRTQDLIFEDMVAIKDEDGNKLIEETSGDTILEEYSSDWEDSFLNIEYDVSGYQRNGTTNNITCNSDSPRYDVSSIFNGTNSYIKVNSNDWMVQGVSEMTINLWAYADDWADKTKLFSCTESGGFNTESGASGYIRHPVHYYTNSTQTSTGYHYNNNAIKLADLSSGWHMFTFVDTNSKMDVYIDGEPYSTYSHTTYGIHYNTNARLFLGCEANTANPSSPYFNGKMSDFRIYYTALDDLDILALYNTPTSIANNGTLMTQGEISEV